MLFNPSMAVGEAVSSVAGRSGLPARMHQRPIDPRPWRLFDLADHEAIKVLCQCGRCSSYGPGVFQRTRRVASDTLIYDLQFRLRGEHCNGWRGFRIWIEDTRPHTNKQFVGDPDIVIVDKPY